MFVLLILMCLLVICYLLIDVVSSKYDNDWGDSH